MVVANRRQILGAILGGLAGRPLGAATQLFESDVDPALLKIAFGSCVSQRKEQGIWSRIAAHEPQAFVMMGDGVYPEHEGADRPVLEQIEAAYEQAATRTEQAIESIKQ